LGGGAKGGRLLIPFNPGPFPEVIISTVLVLTTVSGSDGAAESAGEGLEPDNDNKLETMSGPFRLSVEDPLGSSNVSNRLFPVLLLVVGGGIGLGSGEGGAGQTPRVAALSSRFNVR